ncbi:Hypothetical predicted protein, partial [Pelobates cultripes]
TTAVTPLYGSSGTGHHGNSPASPSGSVRHHGALIEVFETSDGSLMGSRHTMPDLPRRHSILQTESQPPSFNYRLQCDCVGIPLLPGQLRKVNTDFQLPQSWQYAGKYGKYYVRIRSHSDCWQGS